MNHIKQIYSELYRSYGSQGWWPLIEFKGNNPTKTGSIHGYHPNNYEVPSSRNQIYQVCLGAILTQSTSWVSVEKALLNLQKLNAIDPERLMKLSDRQLKEAIKPAGYFNQKSKKLRVFTDFFLTLNNIPKRQELLAIWGIGRETADSILLYGFKIPTFVIDAYTRRIFTNLGYINEKADYDEIKALFEDNLKRDLVIYQEYHALLVEHAKRYYSKKADHKNCPLYKKYAKAGGKGRD